MQLNINPLQNRSSLAGAFIGCSCVTRIRRARGAPIRCRRDNIIIIFNDAADRLNREEKRVQVSGCGAEWLGGDGGGASKIVSGVGLLASGLLAGPKLGAKVRANGTIGAARRRHQTPPPPTAGRVLMIPGAWILHRRDGARS